MSTGTSESISVRPATHEDESRWRELWAGYNAFYEADIPETITQLTWRRILNPAVPVLGRVAELDGRVVGFSNSVLHESTWEAAPICYLEDLFVEPGVRGHGVGRLLLQDLVVLARQNGWPRLYWHTRGNNVTARRLYDSFTPADDFVRYVMRLEE